MTDYQKRLVKVLEYIDQHVDQDISLETLCQVAHFSKYHFHRIFSAGVGMSLHQYILFLKLKRAAHQLFRQKDKSIIEIALDAGYNSHEAFTRAFKKVSGLTPAEFREHPNLMPWRIIPYNPLTRGNTMKIDIKTLPTTRIAAVKHRGDPERLQFSLATLITWANANQLKMIPGEAFGIAYNDPDQVPAEEFKFDIGIKVSDKQAINDQNVCEMTLEQGRFAVARHLGSLRDVGNTVKKLYLQWLPESGESLRDHPVVFQYHNFETDVPESALITDICLPIE